MRCTSLCAAWCAGRTFCEQAWRRSIRLGCADLSAISQHFRMPKPAFARARAQACSGRLSRTTTGCRTLMRRLIQRAIVNICSIAIPANASASSVSYGVRTRRRQSITTTVWGLVGVLRGVELAQRYTFEHGRLTAVGAEERLAVGRRRRRFAGKRRHSSCAQRAERRRLDQHSCLWRQYRRRTPRGVHRVRRHKAIYFRLFQRDAAQSLGPVERACGSARMTDVTPLDVRRDLIFRREIALFDLREENVFASGHPLFAANLPLSRP